MNRAITLPSAEKIGQLDKIAKEYGGALVLSDSPFSATMTLAVGMGQLRDLLTEDVMQPIMALMNSPLGFLTDRSGKPRFKNGQQQPPQALYKWDEVRDCVIEATLRGFYIVGNEFNIIAGRFYGAKSGFQRKVKQHPGVTDLKDYYEIPRINGDKGAVVKCRATWKLNGVEDGIEREFAVKGDSYSTADSYTGKAERKLMAAVHAKLTGQTSPDGDASDSEGFIDISATTVPATEVPTTEALAGKKKTVKEAAPAAEAKATEAPAKTDERNSDKQPLIAEILKQKNAASIPMADLMTAIKGYSPEIPTDLNDLSALGLPLLRELSEGMPILIAHARKLAEKRKS